MTNKILIAKFICSLFIVIGCTQTSTIPSANKLVLIFKAPPENGYYQVSKNGPYTNPRVDLSYVDDNFIKKEIELSHNGLSDTVIIETSRENIEVVHQYKAVGMMPFLFQNGDTVIFTYNKNIPIVQVVNREVKQGDLIYCLELRNKLYVDNFSSFERLKNIIFFFDRDIPNFNIREQIPLQESNLLAQAKDELIKESALLDSLVDKKYISRNTYDFYTNHLEFKAIEMNLIPRDSAFTLGSEFSSYPKEWMYYSFFRNALERYVYSQIYSKMPRQAGVNNFEGDHRMVFDSIFASSQISGIAKEWILFERLEPIIRSSTLEESFSYIELYDSISSGFFETNVLIEKFRLGEKVSTDMNFMSISGEEVSFKELMNDYRGRLVYIDFWASWCRPCIASFPASKELRTSYSNKDIIFFYLSIDDEYENWKNMAKKFDLGKHSYWISNKFTSELYKELAVERIPRYLLFDNTGGLVHKFAPGPQKNELKALFDELLIN